MNRAAHHLKNILTAVVFRAALTIGARANEGGRVVHVPGDLRKQAETIIRTPAQSGAWISK